MKTKAQELSIVFGILARDCVKSLENNISRVETLGSYFKEYHVIAYENDSKDGTKELLQKWMKQNTHVVSINETTGEQTIPQESKSVPYPGQSLHRITKMAGFRNKVLSETCHRYSPDLFCFIDIDILEFDPQEFINAIDNAPSDWGALFANGQIILDYGTHTCSNPIQYDYYAYVEEGVNPFAEGDYAIRLIDNLAVSWIEQRHINHNAYHACHSAFNGIGIYKWEAVKDLKYIAYQTEELEAVHASLCEHVPFNYEVAKQGYKLYVVRDLKTIFRYDVPKIYRGLSIWKNYVPSYTFLEHTKGIISPICHYYFRYLKRKLGK